jgi:hypothetical protein
MEAPTEMYDYKLESQDHPNVRENGLMKPAKLHYLIIPLLSDNMYQPVSVQ